MLNLLFVLPTQFPAREQKERNTDYNRERRMNQEKIILTDIICSSSCKINEENEMRMSIIRKEQVKKEYSNETKLTSIATV